MPNPTVAIVGASRDRSKYGNRAVRAYLRQGYDVYPVNPKEGEIEGLKVWPSLSDVPVDRFDRISFYVPPEVGEALLDEVVAKGAEQLWLNPGSESESLVARARELGLDPIQACSILDIGENPNA